MGSKYQLGNLGGKNMFLFAAVRENTSPSNTLHILCVKNLKPLLFSSHFTILHNFVLFYHINPYKVFMTLVIATLQNMRESKADDYFCKALHMKLLFLFSHAFSYNTAN